MPAPRTRVLRLALPLPLPSLFDYLPPEGVDPDERWAGCRARVTFGKKVLVGVIAEAGEAEVSDGLRRVEEILDPVPLLHGELFRSLRWAAAYYHRPLGDVLATALPALLRQGEALPDTARHAWRLTEAGATARTRLRAGTRPRAMAERLAAAPVDENLLADIEQWRATLRSLQERGFVVREVVQEAASAEPTRS